MSDAVSRHQTAEQFVLQFSTGENYTVEGTGLIGRNPRAEPGEEFDRLLRIVDVSKSVSKVHLEFGQDAGWFWVKDRYSGNGTTVTTPGESSVRCQPDRRVRVTRGSQVSLGEQFFVLS